MARGILCSAIGLLATGGKIGVIAGKASLDLALLPPTIALRGLGLIKEEGDKLAGRASSALDETSRKCGI